MNIDVRDIDVADTYDLRRRVLRSGTISRDVEMDGDGEGFHLGAFTDDELVAVSSWLTAPFEHRPRSVAVRLRGMATDPRRQGTGAGAALIKGGLARARRHGADIVWAHARVDALGFYTKLGFDTVGEVYIDPITTGLPHQLIVIDCQS